MHWGNSDTFSEPVATVDDFWTGIWPLLVKKLS